MQFYNSQLLFYNELSELNPKNEDIRKNLATTYSQLGRIYQDKGDFEKALQFFSSRLNLSKEP